MNRGEATDAILDSRCNGNQVAILLGYMRHQPFGSDPSTARSHPSAELLARYCGAQRSTVIRHRKVLIDSGVLVVTKRTRDGGYICGIDFDMLAAFGGSQVTRPTPSRHTTAGVSESETSANRTPVRTSDNALSEDGTTPCPSIGQEVLTSSLSKNTHHSLVAQGSTAELDDDPIWKRLGCPAPGDTVKPKHLTERVLVIYAAWWKRYDAWCKATPGKRNGFHEMHASDLNAIKSALQRRPSGIVGAEAAAAWPIDRLVKATLAAPMAFPDGHERAWTRKEGRFMRPSFTLRNGTTRNQWEDAAKAAVALAERSQQAPTLSVLEGGRSPQTGPTAREIAERLWCEYTSGFSGIRARVAALGVSSELFASWRDMSTRAVPTHTIQQMRASDAKWRRDDYLAAAVPWVEAHLRGAA